MHPKALKYWFLTILWRLLWRLAPLKWGLKWDHLIWGSPQLSRTPSDCELPVLIFWFVIMWHFLFLFLVSHKSFLSQKWNEFWKIKCCQACVPSRHGTHSARISMSRQKLCLFSSQPFLCHRPPLSCFLMSRGTAGRSCCCGRARWERGGTWRVRTGLTRVN